MVGSLVHLTASYLIQTGDHQTGKIRVGIEPIANGRTAQRQGAQRIQRTRYSFQTKSDLASITSEFLAQKDRDRVLKVGAPYLAYRFKF